MTKHNDNESFDDMELMKDFLGFGNNENDADDSDDGGDAKNEEKTHKKSKKSDKIAALEEEKAALNDKYLRLYSEFDNYRRRTAKERLEVDQKVTANLIKELLPVLDDFDRALDNIPAEDERTRELRNGVELIHQKMKHILRLKGLKEIEIAIGSDFDLDYQEAIATIPAPSPELKDKVVDVIEKGYLLNDAVVRYAKVIIGV